MDIARFPIDKLIEIVSNLIETMLQANNKLSHTHITCFHSRAVPNISISSYLTRIHKFAPFSNEVLLSILVYFDRISKAADSFTINSFNIHRLLITSIVIAAKFTSDIYYANSRYAKVGGIPLQELNRLELELLYLIQFQLYIPLKDLQEYADQLLSMSNIIVLPATLEVELKQTRTKPRVVTTALPLTPPYHHHHPYKKPTAGSNKKKKLGLISPKED